MIIEKTHNIRTCPFVRDRPWLVAQVWTLAGVLGFLVLDEDSGTHRGLSFKGAASSRMKLCACPHPSPLSQRPDSRFLLVMAQQMPPYFWGLEVHACLEEQSAKLCTFCEAGSPRLRKATGSVSVGCWVCVWGGRCSAGSTSDLPKVGPKPRFQADLWNLTPCDLQG